MSILNVRCPNLGVFTASRREAGFGPHDLLGQGRSNPGYQVGEQNLGGFCSIWTGRGGKGPVGPTPFPWRPCPALSFRYAFAPIVWLPWHPVGPRLATMF